MAVTTREGWQQPVPGRAWEAAQSQVLKACVFATGLAGIVAEYVMCTLASYLIGNATVQWTLTISLMLFAMGVGSRLTRGLARDLLDLFVLAELGLSLLCGLSAVVVYTLSVYVEAVEVVIYGVAFGIGLLIGVEIPLATRLNDVFEELRVNISGVMEKDYYGALLGGVFFVFVGLPYLGLTYTPIVLGMVNLAVAAFLYARFRRTLRRPRLLGAAFVVVPLVLVTTAFVAEPVLRYGEQRKYADRIVYTEQSAYQRIVVTRWQDDYWLYLDGNTQFSSYDEERYHEPLVHPALQLAPARRRVLVLGGGDGLAARELLKYDDVETITLVDLDPAVTRLASEHPVFVDLNRGALHDARVHVVNEDGYTFLERDATLYDVILVDLPDPKTVGLARLYSTAFYRMAHRHLARGGVLVTQATSPLFAPEAFGCILKTVRAAGFAAVGYHNHVPTLGEWGWVLGVAGADDGLPVPDPHAALRRRLEALRLDAVPTVFLNREALRGMLAFGKDTFAGYDALRVNDEIELKLHQYYHAGAWDVY